MVSDLLIRVVADEQVHKAFADTAGRADALDRVLPSASIGLVDRVGPDLGPGIGLDPQSPHPVTQIIRLTTEAEVELVPMWPIPGPHRSDGPIGSGARRVFELVGGVDGAPAVIQNGGEFRVGDSHHRRR